MQDIFTTIKSGSQPAKIRLALQSQLKLIGDVLQPAGSFKAHKLFHQRQNYRFYVLLNDPVIIVTHELKKRLADFGFLIFGRTLHQYLICHKNLIVVRADDYDLL